MERDNFLKLIYDELDHSYENSPVVQEYLAMVITYIEKQNGLNKDSVYSNSPRVMNCLLRHEDRMKSFFIKTACMSLLSVIIAFVLLTIFYRDLWKIWLIIAGVYLVFEFIFFKKGLGVKYDRYFQKQVEKNISPNLLIEIKKYVNNDNA